MRVFAGALLALFATGPDLAGAGSLAVTLDAHPAPKSCAVVSTATIVAYDATTAREVAYRFVRSDGTSSPTGRIAFSGEGAVAQSVRDTWTPRGTPAWVSLEIVAPQRIRSRRVAVASRCARRMIAATH
ncbi:MAG: hypothetical protein JOZ86_04650 [Candidatus Eremiobacteraeota bacterium]|nr:hypothetical protein [Candidatus Eremiobacteraeota bacterium]